jgi:hypothetical protein
VSVGIEPLRLVFSQWNGLFLEKEQNDSVIRHAKNEMEEQWGFGVFLN